MAVAVVTVGEGHCKGVVTPPKGPAPKCITKTTEAGDFKFLAEFG